MYLNHRQAREHSQFCMIQEVFRCLGKVQEEMARVFVLILIKLCDCSHTQELIKELATVFPLATVSHCGDILRGSIHA